MTLHGLCGFCFPQMANFDQPCAALSCFVSSDYQLVVHVVSSKSALRSEQHHSSVRQEQDAHFSLSDHFASCFVFSVNSTDG